MTVKISAGSSALEERAIDARLRKLELVTDPETREVAAADANNSLVHGGLEELERAQDVGGEMGIDALADVETKTTLKTIGASIASVFTGGDERSAHIALRSAKMTLRGASESFAGFTKRKRFDYDSVLSTFRRLESVAPTLDRVVTDDVLAHATRAEINGLRTEYAHLLKTIGDSLNTMSRLMTHTLVPWINAGVKVHNKTSVELARRTDALTYDHFMTEFSNNTRGNDRKEIVRHFDNYTQYIQGLVSKSSMFS